MQALSQIRSWWEEAKPVFAWLKSNAYLALAATLVLVAAIWLMEHDARLKQEAELGHLRREVTSEVEALRRKAQGSIEEARANQKAIRDLESRRTALEREAAALRSRLKLLREEDRMRVQSAIPPGHFEMAGSAPSRPDSAGFEVRDSGFGPPTEGSGPQGGTRDSGQAAQARQSQISDSRFRSQNLSELAADGFNDQPSIEGHRPPDPNPESQIPNPDLDNCREQVEVQDQLISNCEERAELNRRALEAAKRSAIELGAALKAKDDMAARIDAQHRAELKVARGSRLGRFGRALQYIGVGVVIGMAVAL